MKPSDLPSHPGRNEERITAWLDGELSAKEQAEFEAALDTGITEGFTRAGADAERQSARKLGDLLRRQTAPAGSFPPGEAFNREVLRRIKAETEAELPEAAVPAVPSAPAWPWQRLVWSGTGGLAAAALLFLAFVQPALHHNGPPPEYYAQIFNTTTSDPAISAIAVHSNQENVTVLWIDGLDYVPKQKAHN